MAHVNLVPGSAFGAEGYVRLSYRHQPRAAQWWSGSTGKVTEVMRCRLTDGICTARVCIGGMPVLLLTEDDVARC